MSIEIGGSGHVERILVLTGHFAGKTVNLKAGNSHYQFVDGVRRLYGPQPDVDGECRYLGRCYQAFLEGTDDLRDAQKRDEENRNGDGHVQEDTKQDGQPAVPGDVRPAGQEHAGPQADPDGGADDAAPEGDTGLHPEGGGEDTLTDEQSEAIRNAVLGMDVKDDELWTVQGKPKVDIIGDTIGRMGLTRKQVDKASGGLTRSGVDEATAAVQE